MGISIYQPTQTLYIADYKNGRIQTLKVSQTSTSSETVAKDLYLPSHIYVDNEDNSVTFYVSLSMEGRIEKWTQGASKGIPIVNDCNDCAGVASSRQR